MTFEEYYSHNEEQIRAQLNSADDGPHIRSVLDDHLGRMLIQYNESTTDPLLQESALALTSAARSCLDLTDVYGQIRIWHRSSENDGTGSGTSSWEPGRSGRFSGTARILSRIFPVLGTACLLSLTVLYAVSGASAASIPIVLILAAGGGVLLYLSGRQSAAMAGPPSAGQAVPVPSFDKDRIARTFRRILMTMDRSLEGIAGLPEAQRGQGSAKVSGGDLSDEEDLLMLFSGQLEALYSRDGAYALDELGQVRHYLHRHHIELSDDWSGHKDWFEYVPTANNGVLRPALVHTDDGKLLIKGLAGMHS